MIIIYGDHQPNLGQDVDEWLERGAAEKNENKLNKYITPFLIWTNYDMDQKKIEKMSDNFLPSIILQVGNFELPIFNQYL